MTFVFDERRLEDYPDDEDRYAIGSSNTVVFHCGDESQTVERPTEGAIYEALYRFRSFDTRTLYFSRGAGEGDLRTHRYGRILRTRPGAASPRVIAYDSW